MNHVSEPVDPDSVYSLYLGGFKAQITRIALEVNLFSPLAMGPLEAESVAEACKTDPVGTRALLEYMAAIGMLTHEAGKFGLTPNAETFLVRGKEAYAGDWLLMETDPDMWGSILDTVRTGRPHPRDLPVAQDAWLESYSRSRIDRSIEMWTTVGLYPLKSKDLRILDLACGCGVKTFVLARESAGIHITCVDRPEVLQVARQVADRMEISTQITFRPDDLPKTDFGEMCFDLAFLGQITYSLTRAENLEIFARVHRAVAPGGLLVIDSIMRGETPSVSASTVTLLMRSLTGGAAHSASDYETWLREIGFGCIVVHGEKWLSARKP
jgi:C-methyltransferase